MNEENLCEIGLFWVVEDFRGDQLLVAHVCPDNQTEIIEGLTTCPHSHYRIWAQLQQRRSGLPVSFWNAICDSEYEEWPRGRLVGEARKMNVYADRQIIHNPYKSSICTAYNIKNIDISMHLDSHYRLSRKLGRRIDNLDYHIIELI